MKTQFKWLALVLVVSSSAALAGGLATKARQKEISDDLAPKIAELNEACGSKIALVVDMSKYKEDAWKGYGPSCDLGFDGVKQVCGKNADFKAAVAKNIKTFKCVLIDGKDGSAKVSGSTVEYLVAPTSPLSPDKVAALVTAAVDK